MKLSFVDKWKNLGKCSIYMYNTGFNDFQKTFFVPNFIEKLTIGILNTQRTTVVPCRISIQIIWYNGKQKGLSDY